MSRTPDMTSYVYSPDGHLQKRRDADDNDNDPWPASDKEPPPTDAWPQDTDDTPYTQNWIELTRASSPNASISPSEDLQTQPGQDNGLSTVYETRNLPRDPPPQTLDPTLFLQQSLFSSNATSNFFPSSPRIFPPPPSSAALNWRSPTNHQLTDAEAAALYRIAMPHGPMTAEERASLYRIAMPQGAAPTRHASFSAFEGSATSTSPLTATSPSSSRFSSRPSESGPASLRLPTKRALDATDDGRGDSKRRDHNAIEKKYRDNINGRFRELRECVPSLRSRISRGAEKGKEKDKGREEDDEDGGDDDDDDEAQNDLDGLEPAHKFNKATVIIKAIEYIRHLEAKQQRSAVQECALRERIEAFERLFGARAE